MLRSRSLGRAVQQGQPERVLTDPERIRHGKPEKQHFCGECFGPRSRYQHGLFCVRCARLLFDGDWRDGYRHFVASERARRREAAKKQKRQGQGHA
jgi:hypothetical protein